MTVFERIKGLDKSEMAYFLAAMLSTKKATEDDLQFASKLFEVILNMESETIEDIFKR